MWRGTVWVCWRTGGTRPGGCVKAARGQLCRERAAGVVGQVEGVRSGRCGCGLRVEFPGFA